ncbi:hypothetical protein AXF42_Ash017189 [Apostasia shenzhenica]|uniref:TPX2 C-terminal domain-containing protein n=1 Tax=Apostasia shenzhenica TaxID=1088818 RepID=A0A2H9ZVD4_9ASPA|nr:hypothetical protein AXF42_Ash017189 [Apostasia shenzhenica]
MEDPSSFSTSFSSPPKQREEVKEQAFVRKVQGFVALDQAKHHFHAAQSLAPLTADKKPQNLLKLSAKEQTKPVNFKLHTEERAARRAGFNHLVASKISSMEILRRFEEKIEKVSGRLNIAAHARGPRGRQRSGCLVVCLPTLCDWLVAERPSRIRRIGRTERGMRTRADRAAYLPATE